MNERISIIFFAAVAGAGLALGIVGLVQGGGSSPSEPDQRIATCYELMTDWLVAEEGSEDDIRLDREMDREDCFE